MKYKLTDLSEMLGVYEKELNDTIGEAVYELAKRIVDKTPVDEGTDSDGGLKGNWQAAINNTPVGQTGILDVDGSTTLAGIKNVTDQIGGNVFYLVNNAPYASVVEFGEYPNPPKKGTYLDSKRTKRGRSGPGYFQFSRDGYSEVTPQGMVRVSLTEFDSILTSKVREARR